MTRNFNFSLQKVLDVREIIEETRAMALQKAQADTKSKQQQLQKTQDEKQSVVINPAEDRQSDADISLIDLNARTAYLDQLSKKIEAEHESVTRSQARTDQRRVAYIQASKEKMIMEKLKERHHDRFKKKRNQDQVKDESEIANRMKSRGATDQ